MKFKLYHWPILTAFWISSAFFISYLIAVENDHVSKLLPNISEVGGLAPERFIFGQMINIGAVLMFIIIYIRFQTVTLIAPKDCTAEYFKWNRWSCIPGFLASLESLSIAIDSPNLVTSADNTNMKFKLHYWPILTASWITSTFLVSYLVAIYNNHVSKLFPYISDTGTLPPESCIFGQMLNMGAVLMLITMYIRFRTVQLIDHKGFTVKYITWNRWSSFFGIFSCLGLSLVANFQETSQLIVHTIGAFMAFGLGAVYCIIQAYLTYLSDNSVTLKSMRILLSVLIIPLYVMTTIFTTLSFDKLKSTNALKWTDMDPGYELHLIATFSEWIMAITMIIYIWTFNVEFRLVDLDEISFILKNH